MFIEHFQRLTPRGLLGGVDLAQVQHLPLHRLPAGHAAVLHHAEVVMILAILAAMMGAQKHAPDYRTPARRFLGGWFPPHGFYRPKPHWQRRIAETFLEIP